MKLQEKYISFVKNIRITTSDELMTKQPKQTL